MPKSAPTREQLIALGVKHLKEFGYPDVTAANILTDRVYSAFFVRMLEGTVEEAKGTLAADECRRLIDEIGKVSPKE